MGGNHEDYQNHQNLLATTVLCMISGNWFTGGIKTPNNNSFHISTSQPVKPETRVNCLIETNYYTSNMIQKVFNKRIIDLTEWSW